MKERLYKPKLKIKVNQSRSYKGISKSLETKSENQNRACKRINRSTKTIYEYQSKKRLETYHKSNLQPKIQEVFILSLDSTIYNPKC